MRSPCCKASRVSIIAVTPCNYVKGKFLPGMEVKRLILRDARSDISGPKLLHIRRSFLTLSCI